MALIILTLVTCTLVLLDNASNTSAGASLAGTISSLYDIQELLKAYNKKDYVQVAIKLIDIKFKIDPPETKSRKELRLLVTKRLLEKIHPSYLFLKSRRKEHNNQTGKHDRIFRNIFRKLMSKSRQKSEERKTEVDSQPEITASSNNDNHDEAELELPSTEEQSTTTEADVTEEESNFENLTEIAEENEKPTSSTTKPKATSNSVVNHTQNHGNVNKATTKVLVKPSENLTHITKPTNKPRVSKKIDSTTPKHQTTPKKQCTGKKTASNQNTQKQNKASNPNIPKNNQSKNPSSNGNKNSNNAKV